MAQPVSVQVCTLNEERNIGPCLEAILANDPDDVVVIDGGSADETVTVAKRAGVRVIQAGPVGLARQRRLGYLTSPCDYTAFVDADDRLDARWLAVMRAEMDAGRYAALQSLIRVQSDGTWWSGAWNEYFCESIASTSDTIIVGRPALYRTAALLQLPEPTGMTMEDTEMSVWFVRLGLRQGIGSAISFRLCPASREENWSKWRSYGRGYREFAEEHPERRIAILKHMLVTVPIVRGWRPVMRGHWTQPAFGAMMAANYVAGWIEKGRQEA